MAETMKNPQVMKKAQSEVRKFYKWQENSTNWVNQSFRGSFVKILVEILIKFFQDEAHPEYGPIKLTNCFFFQKTLFS